MDVNKSNFLICSCTFTSYSSGLIQYTEVCSISELLRYTNKIEKSLIQD